MIGSDGVRAGTQAAAPAGWKHVRLNRHPTTVAGRTPEHHHEEHLAIVSLGANGGGELNAAGGFSARCRGAGGAVVVPAGQPHSAAVAGGDSEYVSLLLDPALLLRAASDAGVKGRVEVIAKSVESDRTIRGVALSLLSELEQGGVCGPLYAQSLSNILAVHLLRNYTEARPAAARFTGGLSGRRLRRVTDYISEHYGGDVSLAELAAEAGVSPFHFAREFKRATGLAPHQYLIEVRIERAKSLLAGNEMPLAQVSLSAGFSSQSHFTRLFRRHTGTTPKSYRERRPRP